MQIHCVENVRQDTTAPLHLSPLYHVALGFIPFKVLSAASPAHVVLPAPPHLYLQLDAPLDPIPWKTLPRVQSVLLDSPVCQQASLLWYVVAGIIAARSKWSVSSVHLDLNVPLQINYLCLAHLVC